MVFHPHEPWAALTRSNNGTNRTPEPSGYGGNLTSLEVT